MLYQSCPTPREKSTPEFRSNQPKVTTDLMTIYPDIELISPSTNDLLMN